MALKQTLRMLVLHCCDRNLFLSFPRQEKIQKLYDRKLHGDFDTNSHIQKKKEFRNPRCVSCFLLVAVLFPSVIQQGNTHEVMLILAWRIHFNDLIMIDYDLTMIFKMQIMGCLNRLLHRNLDSADFYNGKNHKNMLGYMQISQNSQSTQFHQIMAIKVQYRLLLSAGYFSSTSASQKLCWLSTQCR